jgi:hypothetical protein
MDLAGLNPEISYGDGEIAAKAEEVFAHMYRM